MSESRFDVAGFLAGAGLVRADALRVEPLAGGYWNQVFRARDGAADLVVKHFAGTAVEASLFPILPEAEAGALQALSGLGIAPEPVGFWPAAGDRGPVLVYRFVPGTMWAGEVADVARLLLTLHGVEAAGFRDHPVTPGAVMEEADGLPRPPADDPLWLRLGAARPAPRDVPPLPRRALIHTDFSAGNLIDGPEGLYCIDWQCPALADPAEDLWTFLSPAFQLLYDRGPFDAASVARFRDAYGEAAVLARLDAMAPYFAYRMAHYCVFRRHQLDGVDPAGSERYRKASEAEIAGLEV